MFKIGAYTVKESITLAKFACDLIKCKGACCTMEGGRGAPLEDEEIGFIKNALPSASAYLSGEHREYIKYNGFFEGEPGDYTTKCINQKACVFVCYDGEIAKCSLERAFNECKTSWKKPLSCHLFPIRESGGFTRILRNEYISECEPGFIRGNEENVLLLDFLEEPLRRRIGDEQYEQLQRQAKGVDSKLS